MRIYAASAYDQTSPPGDSDWGGSGGAGTGAPNASSANTTCPDTGISDHLYLTFAATRVGAGTISGGVRLKLVLGGADPTKVAVDIFWTRNNGINGGQDTSNVQFLANQSFTFNNTGATPTFSGDPTTGLVDMTFPITALTAAHVATGTATMEIDLDLSAGAGADVTLSVDSTWLDCPPASGGRRSVRYKRRAV